MDWLKRNWMDALMAGLILAVIGGFLALLLRGGVFVSNSQDTSTTTPTTVPAPTGTPDSIPASGVPSTPASGVASTPVIPSTPKPAMTTPLDVPEIPEAPANPATAPSASNNSSTKTTNSSILAVPTRPSGLVTVPTRPTGSIATKPDLGSQKVAPKVTKLPSPKGSYARADFLRNYRIAAGSYSSFERAKKAVVQLRSRGLPAQTFPSGNSHVVVVGPYARQASARTALARVRQSFLDAILYRPDGTREVLSRAPTPAGGVGTPATLTAQSVYLQVGAFKDIKGATALLEKLQNAGFKPLTKNISGLLRVLVGPFASSQIKNTRADLKNSGFDAFLVNL